MKLLAILLLLSTTLAGCTKSEAPGGAPDAGDEALAIEYQEILGRLKLVKEEYVDAIRDGEIIDAQEYEEAEMFAEQAALRFRRVAEHARGKDAAAAERIDGRLKELVALVAARGPVETEETLVAALLEDLAKVNPSPIPPAVEGTRAAVAKSDAQIGAERIVEGYRIGLVLAAPRTVHLRQPDGTLRESAAAADANAFLAVVLREQRTKRFLPGAGIRVRVGQADAVELPHLWGEFPLYGANLHLPDGAFEVEVEISPPAVHRHGDMLSAFVRPAAARFSVKEESGRRLVEGAPPTETPDDYAIGDDVLQALGEARWKGEAGPYFLCFIAEAPEPIWLWKDGKPELRPATPGETNHLEIAVLEKGSMRMVPEVEVSLRLDPEEGDAEPLEFPLHPLLSQFHHYGNTVTVPPGRYRVTARVMPPRFGSFTPGLFEAPVEATFSWDHTKGAAAPEGSS